MSGDWVVSDGYRGACYYAYQRRDEPNQALQQTAAAILVSRSSTALSAAAAAELGRSAAEGERMVHANDFEPISIRGRFAFALTCLEVMGQRWGVDGVYFRELVEQLWEFTSRTPLACAERDWFKDVERLGGRRWQEFTERLRAEAPSLSADQLHAIRHAFKELWAIAGRDMYAQPQVWNTIGPTLNVAGILLRWGLAVPQVEPFARSRWGERVAFGEPRSREFFRIAPDAASGAAPDRRGV